LRLGHLRSATPPDGFHHHVSHPAQGNTGIIQILEKTFYNSGSPIMLGVFIDVTPTAA